MEEHNEQHLNPLLSIWLQPRVTIQQVMEREEVCMTILLITLAGFPYIFDEIDLSSGLAGLLQLPILLFKGALYGGTAVTTGLVPLYCTGKWLGGKAKFEDIFVALIWSAVPTICTTLLLLFLPASTAENTIVTTGAIVIEIIAGIWSFILVLTTLSQVQDFSFWRVLGNMALAALVSALVAITFFVLLVFVIGISINALGG